MNNPFEPILSFFEKKIVYGPILTIIISYIIYKTIKSIIKRIILKSNHEKNNSYQAKKRLTVINLVSNFVKYVIIIVSSIIILQIYGVNTSSIIASVGVLSAVIGLAFQDALKDFIGGVTIILENYYIVGDYVKYNDFTGKVISIGFKSTKIANFNNEVLIVANRNVNEIINLSQNNNSVWIDIPVAYEEKTKNVENAIDKIIKKLKKDSLINKDTIEYKGISNLDSSSIKYLLTFTTVHDGQWQAKRNALKIIKDTFEEEKIKIPFNQIEVRHGKDI